ncbi:MAG: discoidin domain-containing protein [Thermoanaerobaculia bacterium]
MPLHSRHPAVRLLLGTVLCASLPLSASAAEEAGDSLRRQLLPARSLSGTALAGDPEWIRDGRVASEGGRWDSPLAVRFVAPNAALTLDLGDATAIGSALLQADADDAYLLEGSLDGTEFHLLATAPSLTGVAGLRTRAVALPGDAVRYVRLRPTGGDGRASATELLLFPGPPGSWVLELETVEEMPQSERPGPAPGWNDRSSRWWELLLALLAAALLALPERGADPAATLPRRRGGRLPWIAACGLAVLTYFNFGFFHFTNYIHNWDTFHYYLGAKYFPELGYDGLYDCVTVADSRAADPETRRRAAERTVRDLRTNELVPGERILEHPERCLDRFHGDRFASFSADLAWFRGRDSRDRWDEYTADHGFNATPVWMIAGTTLANLAPATDRSITLLTGLDLLYFVALVGVLIRGFGLRTATVALLVLATALPSRFYWTGGSFLRWDWLFFLAASLALAYRRRPLASGLCLGYAALLRLFPILLAVGPLALLVGVGWRAFRRSGPVGRGAAIARELTRGEGRSPFRFLVGMALFAAVALPLSVLATGNGSPERGVTAWRQFLANTSKHSHTPLTNNMGLMTALTFRSDEIGRVLHDENATEPWERWKDARLAARAEQRPLQLGLAAVALLAVAVGTWRRRELWISLALAAAWIPFVLEMTSYYFAFLLAPALLWRERRAVAPLLLALSAIGQFLSLAPFAGMPTWRDEVYSWLSVATVVALAALLALFVPASRSVPAADADCLNLR